MDDLNFFLSFKQIFLEFSVRKQYSITDFSEKRSNSKKSLHHWFRCRVFANCTEIPTELYPGHSPSSSLLSSSGSATDWRITQLSMSSPNAKKSTLSANSTLLAADHKASFSYTQWRWMASHSPPSPPKSSTSSLSSMSSTFTVTNKATKSTPQATDTNSTTPPIDKCIDPGLSHSSSLSNSIEGNEAIKCASPRYLPYWPASKK